MNYEQFNIKYKDYLEEGHYGLDIDIPELTEFLDNVFQELTKIPGFTYSQIKEKFGEGRFYTNIYRCLGRTLGFQITNYIENKIVTYLTLEELIRKRNKK